MTVPNRPPETPEAAQLRRDFAKISYERALAGAYDRSRAVIDFATLGLRSIILVNGGAIVGLVTFLGHFPSAADSTGAWWACGLFVIGLFAALVAVLLSYLAQERFFWSELREAEREAIRVFNLDDGEAYKSVVREQGIGRSFQIGAILTALASAILFVAGSFAALTALIGAPGP